ncbi:hypothetical protein COK37_13225 [Bacillus thuringiensis]|uniref:hypothetical protein n=2 Tax=Bacillus thuringiensis TaxID=1428 RepID=UPI000BF49CA1|nr:hypothetical protein [Bacillus thuringiensis]PEV36710.1 hypothetical protein CN432_31175 [Bacillus thuringiensis]PFR67912.1 hypothetical protein COK37_13225 [Bacillus thuringiensis]PFT74295.1 hypothetical protein COK70_28450 [Bacillus thuringiensis]PFV86302.1 hypothetical protein COL06_20125 [Bacillus thuringiensis]
MLYFYNPFYYSFIKSPYIHYTFRNNEYMDMYIAPYFPQQSPYFEIDSYYSDLHECRFGYGEITQVLSEHDDPEAKLITDPQQVQLYSQALGISQSLPLIIPPKPKQISGIHHSSKKPPTSPPGGTLSGGASAYGGFPNFYEVNEKWLFGFNWPEYKGDFCYKVFKSRLGKYKVKYPCLLTRNSTIDFYAHAKFPRNTTEYLKTQINECMIYAEGAAKGAGITAFIAAWSEGWEAAAAAGLSAAFTAWQVAFGDCIKKIPENTRNQISFWLSWYQQSTNDWHHI